MIHIRQQRPITVLPLIADKRQISIDKLNYRRALKQREHSAQLTTSRERDKD